MKRSKLGRTRYDAKACCAHKLPLFARMRLESRQIKRKNGFPEQASGRSLLPNISAKRGDGNVANLGDKIFM